MCRVIREAILKIKRSSGPRLGTHVSIMNRIPSALHLGPSRFPGRHGVLVRRRRGIDIFKPFPRRDYYARIVRKIPGDVEHPSRVRV